MLKFIKYGLMVSTLILCFNTTYTQQNNWYVSGKGIFYQPIGALSDIFKNTFSGSLILGNRNNAWEWEGKIEYLKFDKTNDEKLFYSNVSHTLDIAGIGFNANYLFLKTEGILIPKLTFGAGIYRWTYKRDKVLDSMKTVLTSDFSQQDWSGGINLGCGLEYKFLEPLSLLIDINYFAVIGEIWPALAIRLENVSTFQNINLMAGIRYNF